MSLFSVTNLHDGSTGVISCTQKATGSGGGHATGSGSGHATGSGGGHAPGKKVSDYTTLISVKYCSLHNSTAHAFIKWMIHVYVILGGANFR